MCPNLRSLLLAVTTSVVVTVASLGCGLFDLGEGDPFDPGGGGGLLPSLEGAGIGETCSSAEPCRYGLRCAEGRCAPVGNAQEGEFCGVSAECLQGLVCGLEAKCVRSGGAQEGESCQAPEDCAEGLRCNLRGLHLLCEADGARDFGATCGGSGECLSPLQCSAEGVCNLIALAVMDGTLFMPNVACAPDDDTGPFRVYFQVPDDEPLDEFYRLPFPNDARVRGGKLDLSGHHDPGLLYVGGELVHNYLGALEESFSGFSVNPTVFFRFSQAIDFNSVQGGGVGQSIYYVNVDPDSSRFGQAMSMGWSMTTGRGKFICQNRLELRAGWGTPLEHGSIYAAFLTDGIRGPDNALPVQAADLGDLLGDAAPDDPRLQEPWERYAPLRAYLADKGIAPETVMGATVFTTMNPDARMGTLRTAVRAQGTPTLSPLTRCGEGVTSPCAGAEGERGCVNPGGPFHELHGSYEATVWQRGTRPYLTKESGGEIVFAGGAPLAQGQEEICVALAIPDGEMPEAGWPVLLYAHGTGGDFTSFVREGLAGRLAQITLPDGRTTKLAVVGYDGVMHGPRRGETELDPDPLFYNFGNPYAARGNVEQAAADLFALQLLVEELAINADESPTGAAIRFDPANIFFLGHSQGAQGGPLYASYEPNLRAAVLSGAGGGLALSLVNKTSPVDIAGAVSYVLLDGQPGTVSASEPFLALLQMFIDPVDPLNYARMLFHEPPEGVGGKHLMMSYGYGDSYTPEPTQRAFAEAARLPVAEPFPGELPGYGIKTSYPVSANRGSAEVPLTAGLFPAVPEEYDGHFVLFQDSVLSSQFAEFLGTAVLDGVPSVTAR